MPNVSKNASPYQVINEGTVKMLTAVYDLLASSTALPATHSVQTPAMSIHVSADVQLQGTAQADAIDDSSDQATSTNRSSSSSFTGSTVYSSATCARCAGFDANGKDLCSSPEAFQRLAPLYDNAPLFMDLFDRDPVIRWKAIAFAKGMGVDEDRMRTLDACLDLDILGRTFQQVVEVFKAFGMTEGEYRALHLEWAPERHEWL